MDSKRASISEDRRATEHLANERTFLAWVRTSVSIVSLGFVVAKFGLWLRQLGTRLAPHAATSGHGLSGPLGMGMIGFGGALALLAAIRFHVVNRQIDQGEVSVDRAMVWLIAVVMGVVSAVLVAYLALSTTSGP